MPAHIARLWQRLTVLAGLVLASALFMPNVRCDEVYVPVTQLHTVIADAPRPGAGMATVYAVARGDHAGMFAMWLGPYGFGALAAVAACVRSFRQRRSWVDLLLVAHCAAIGACIVSSGVQTLREPPRSDSQTVLRIALEQFVPPVLVALYGLRAACRQRCTGVLMTCVGAALVVHWDVYWVTAWDGGFRARYGWYVMISAAAVLVVCAYLEALAVDGRSWWRTLLSIVTASLTPAPRPQQCLKCGYLLIGLPEPRCPECGTPFDPALLGAMNAAVHETSATTVAATNA